MAARAKTPFEKKSLIAAMREQFRDFRTFLPSVRMRIIFDVGANVGQSTAAFRQAYPKARVFAFEPVRQSFDALSASCEGDANTRCFNLALGESQGRVTMEVSGSAVTNRIVTKPKGQATTTDVEISTGDAFCAAHRVARIDFLKIDAEGYDLKVCAGFSDMIGRQNIELIQVETGMNPDNVTHVPLQEFVEFFQSSGYMLFRLYDQALHPRRPRLRRANAVFISPARLEAGAGKKPSPSLARL
jgi:FkbM family methyltransferase